MPRTWPYEFHASFEGGDTTEWSEGATIDDDHSASVVHYTELAASGMTPYSGAAG